MPEGVVARRLAHCDALHSQLASVQLDFEAHCDRLDAVAAGHTRLQRQMDAALHISEEEISLEVEKCRREAEEEEEEEEDGSGARAAASALARYLAGQQSLSTRGRSQPRSAPTTLRAPTNASRRPAALGAAGSLALGGGHGAGGAGGAGGGRGAGRGAARGLPRPRRVPEGCEESSVR